MTLTLCRSSDFLLRASQPEPPPASSFSRSSSKYGLTRHRGEYYTQYTPKTISEKSRDIGGPLGACAVHCCGSESTTALCRFVRTPAKMVAQLDDKARNQVREKLLEYQDEADEALLDYVVLVRPSGSSNVYKDAMASDGSADGSIERPGKGGRAA